jgi:hypothetical protein
MAGISVWCQTGGWHRFRRLAFLPGNKHPDTSIRLNAAAAIHIFRYRKSVEQSVTETVGEERAPATLQLLRHADTLVLQLLYIEDFARQKLFFRRVRIPPLLNVYWDCLFINHAVSKTLRHFVPDPERALRSGEGAATLFPDMIRLAREAELPVADIEHMRDFFAMLLLARRYYFLPFDEELAERIRSAKKDYKKRYPATERERYRIKVSFEPFKVKRRTLSWAASLLLRKKRGYRVIDHILTLNLLGLVFRIEAVGGVLVAPVGGHALLGDPVHGLRPDLHLDPHAPRAHHCRVQGPVIVPLGGRDIVLEAVRQRGPGPVGHAQGPVAVLFGIDDHTEGVDVRKL